MDSSLINVIYMVLAPYNKSVQREKEAESRKLWNAGLDRRCIQQNGT